MKSFTRSEEETQRIVDQMREDGYKELISRGSSEMICMIANSCGLYKELFHNRNFIEIMNSLMHYHIKDIEEGKNVLKFIKAMNNGYLRAFCVFTQIEFIIGAIERNIQMQIMDIVDYEASEICLKTKIIKNFNKYFPTYEFIKDEYQLPDKTRIDILAKDIKTNKYVIIELKSPSKGNVNKQLLHYSSFFDNPIMIGVNHNGEKLENAIYMNIK